MCIGYMSVLKHMDLTHNCGHTDEQCEQDFIIIFIKSY